MFHLDDRYLKEAEREARKTGRVLVGDAVSQQFSNVIAQWSTEGKERQLVTDARGGNTAAFDDLIRLYWRKLWALCCRLVNKQREDAEDLMQDVQLKAWEKLNTFHPDQKFGPWIFRIAVNTHIDMIRHKQRAVEQLGWIVSLNGPIGSDESEEDGEISLMEQLPADIPNPADEVALRETFKKCWFDLTLDVRMILISIYRWRITFKDLGWLKGSKEIEPGDDEKTIKNKRQSAHQNGRYHVKIALQKLEESLRKEGLNPTRSQVLPLLEEQETEGGATNETKC